MARCYRLTMMALILLMVWGCGKSSSMEGQVVDGKGAPVAKVKMIAKQGQPIKGYEQFEATPGGDGKFTLKGLFPNSVYDIEVYPLAGVWASPKRFAEESPPEGLTKILKHPIVIEHVVTKDSFATLQGHVVDGKGQPIPNLKLLATPVRLMWVRDNTGQEVKPAKGYEKLETVTDGTGKFAIKGLFPSSAYEIIPYVENQTTSVRLEVESGPEGHTKMLPEPVKIRFTRAKDGVISDNVTGLEWYVGPGQNISWDKDQPKSWTESLTAAGGGWRMPTIPELKAIYQPGADRNNIDPIFQIQNTNGAVWSGQLRDASSAWFFSFSSGREHWCSLGDGMHSPRAFAVRSRRSVEGGNAHGEPPTAEKRTSEPRPSATPQQVIPPSQPPAGEAKPEMASPVPQPSQSTAVGPTSTTPQQIVPPSLPAPPARDPLTRFQVGQQWAIDWQSQFKYRGVMQIRQQLAANQYLARITVSFFNNKNKEITVSMDGRLTIQGKDVVINCSNASKSWWDTDDFHLEWQHDTMTGYNIDKKGRRGTAVFRFLGSSSAAAPAPPGESRGQ
jgi:hypothetical protein